MTVLRVIIILLFAFLLIWQIFGLVKQIVNIIKKKKNLQDNKTSDPEVISCEVHPDEKENS